MATNNNAQTILAAALLERGFRTLARFAIKDQDATHAAAAFRMYIKGHHVVIMQEMKDGGADLYMPVSESINIVETIEALDRRLQEAK